LSFGAVLGGIFGTQPLFHYDRCFSGDIEKKLLPFVLIPGGFWGLRPFGRIFTSDRISLCVWVGVASRHDEEEVPSRFPAQAADLQEEEATTLPAI